jgi:hypothetical protein
LHLADRQQLVVDDLGDGDCLDLAGRDVAEAGDDELADCAAFPSISKRNAIGDWRCAAVPDEG